MPRRRRPNPATIQTSLPPVSPPTSPTGMVDLTYYEVEKIFRKRRLRLPLREQALAKATQKPSNQAPPEPQPGPSRSLSPRPQTLLERINQQIKAQTIPKPTPVEVRFTTSTPRQRSKNYPGIENK
ncbi:hypothetical protein OUZ56_025286 [Daphnia magna]|uniref:Uncharacterized protein n=1 Tax=Daphnia magna TaxID=35525 RepID=A0ABQ9ZJE1_9CRUS|nr:hypothetical protein OUZ56_025286 [Daphnia magna]